MPVNFSSKLADLITQAISMLQTYLKMMLSLPLFLLPLSVQASECAQQTGCERKACEIERKMDIAQQNGRSYQYKGLSEALSEVIEHCTEAGIRDDLLAKIEKSSAELTEYREELDEAKADNDQEKMHKYQRKILQEQAEISEYQTELSMFTSH